MQHIEQTGRPLTGRHVLCLFAGFFGIIFATNAYMITVALTTHSGVVANEPYKVGLKYNDRITAAEEQAKLGWQDAIVLSERGETVAVTLHDSAGNAVPGLKVTAALGRPATVAGDERLDLVETTPGTYEAAAGLKEPGAYIVTVEARRGAGDSPTYRARKRLWLKP